MQPFGNIDPACSAGDQIDAKDLLVVYAG